MCTYKYNVISKTSTTLNGMIGYNIMAGHSFSGFVIRPYKLGLLFSDPYVLSFKSHFLQDQNIFVQKNKDWAVVF